MTVLGIMSAKGGVGSSIVATNLACAFSQWGRTALVDLHPGSGVDDLLLDLVPRHSWDELLPVTHELEPRHFELAATQHASGIEYYAAPDRWDIDVSTPELDGFIQALSQRVGWLLLDIPAGLIDPVKISCQLLDRLLFVTTVDPISLRAVKSRFDQMADETRDIVGLVINQYTRHHPVKPRELADGLGMPLLATLPRDVRAVGFQVNFGRACVLDTRSGFGRAILAFAARLHQHRQVELRYQQG